MQFTSLPELMSWLLTIKVSNAIPPHVEKYYHCFLMQYLSVYSELTAILPWKKPIALLILLATCCHSTLFSPGISQFM